MQPLRGFTATGPHIPVSLKQQALFFDSLLLIKPDPKLAKANDKPEIERKVEELDYLAGEGLVTYVRERDLVSMFEDQRYRVNSLSESNQIYDYRWEFEEILEPYLESHNLRMYQVETIFYGYKALQAISSSFFPPFLLNVAREDFSSVKLNLSDPQVKLAYEMDRKLVDIFVRRASSLLTMARGIPTIPVCSSFYPIDEEAQEREGNVFQIALKEMPAPDETCAWSDIIAFKNEMNGKQWDFRRFLHTLSSKKQTEAEIRDDIEWTLQQYSREMEIFNLKRSISFIEAYVVPTIEAIERLKPSAFFRGMAEIKKRKVELLEGEKVSGRECAYVFHAKKHFGQGG